MAHVERAPDPPPTVAPQERIEDALNLLEKAGGPLVLVGKGMAWSRAEDEVRPLIERAQLSFCVRRWARTASALPRRRVSKPRLVVPWFGRDPAPQPVDQPGEDRLVPTRGLHFYQDLTG